MGVLLNHGVSLRLISHLALGTCWRNSKQIITYEAPLLALRLPTKAITRVPQIVTYVYAAVDKGIELKGEQR